MKEIISITELAKLRNISTETLRYYDRINLFKPTYVDPNTGYRYYSVLYQTERIGTIKELQQLGMSLKEIEKYLNNRNTNKSLQILISKLNELEKKMEELQYLHSNLTHKIETTKSIIQQIDINKPSIKQFPKRNYISHGYECEDDTSLSFEVLKNEYYIQKQEFAPIIASNRIGVIRKFENEHFKKSLIPFIFILSSEGNNKTYLKNIKSNKFACLFYEGNIWNIDKELSILEEYVKENNMKYVGDLIQIIQIDMSLTGDADKMIIELQIPVK